MRTEWMHKRFFGEWTPMWVLFFLFLAIFNPVSCGIIAGMIFGKELIVFGAVFGLAIMMGVTAQLAWTIGSQKQIRDSKWKNALCQH